MIKNTEERAYLDLIKLVLKNGYDKPNRTGVKTRSITGATLRFKLHRDDHMIIPLITTKLTSFRLIATELLWFLSGDTKTKTLTDQNNHIWGANGSRDFLNSRGFINRMEGDLGPLYGYQWRHWNAPYVEHANRSLEYKPIGIDQITNVIDSIKNNPWSRRHIISTWNPEQLNEMCLPPCHCFFQFVVRPQKQNDDERESTTDCDTPYWIDCILTQRSADIPLGAPFNIASYSLLTHMIAHVCGLRAGELIHNMGDTHIYHNQFEGCKEQISRSPFKFPILEFNNPPNNIDDWSMDNFNIVDYKHHNRIKYPFTV